MHVATWDPDLALPPRELVAWAFEALSAQDREDVFSSAGRGGGGEQDGALLAAALASPVAGLRVASRGFCRRVLARALAERAGGEAGGSGVAAASGLRLAVAAGGKPYLEGGSGERGGSGGGRVRSDAVLVFNASNTAGAVGVAVHWVEEGGGEGDVGFDLERWRRMEDGGGGARAGGAAAADGRAGGSGTCSRTPLEDPADLSPLPLSPSPSPTPSLPPEASPSVSPTSLSECSSPPPPDSPTSPLPPSPPLPTPPTAPTALTAPPPPAAPAAPTAPPPPTPPAPSLRRLLRLAGRWFSPLETRALRACVEAHARDQREDDARVSSAARSAGAPVAAPRPETRGGRDAPSPPSSRPDVDPARPPVLFSSLWTLKESYVKCLGRGIARGPGTKGFSVLLGPSPAPSSAGRAPRPLALAPPPEDADRRFALWLLRLRGHHLAGLCWDGGKDGVRATVPAPAVRVHLYDPRAPEAGPCGVHDVWGAGEGEGARQSRSEGGLDEWGELLGVGGSDRKEE